MAKVQKMLVSLDLRGNELRNVVLGTEVGTAPGAIWFDLATSTVKFVDADNTVQSIEPKSYVDAAVAAEAASRASEITRVEGLISAETSARQAADQQIIATVQGGFAQGTARMNAIDAKNAEQDGRLTNAEGRLTSAEDRLSVVENDIYTTNTNLNTAVGEIDGRLDTLEGQVANLDGNFATDAEVAAAVGAEATARQAADQAIDTRVSAAEADITALEGDLAAETARAEAAEAGLDARLTAAEGDIDALAAADATEAAARAAADATLQSNIDAEAAARAAADSAETTARQAADAALQSGLNALNSGLSSLASNVQAGFASGSASISALQGENAAQTARMDNIEANYATKLYVDQAIQGLDITESVKAAAQSVASTSGLDAIDGVNVVAGDRVLVLGGANQGIWTVASGAWTLVTGPDAGTFVFVENGTTFGSNGYVLNANSEWVQFSGAGQVTAGAGLAKAGNELSVTVGNGLKVENDAVQLDGPVSVANGGTGADNAADARANLGATTKHTELLEGDGTTDAFVVSHTLGTDDVVVSVRDAATGEMVMVSVTATSTSAVTVEFGAAPAVGEDYKVVIVG